MVEIFRRYRVHPAQARAFEHAYGSTGPWAALFGRHGGFRRVRLFRHREDPAVYVMIGVWESQADWEDFRGRFGEESAELDRRLGMLKLEEHLLGFYEGPDEYRPPLDTLA
ncbi:MAG: antibiotic biosynthesis monooxygenase family protein [Vulcanimicrobiaceae bacterium]